MAASPPAAAPAESNDVPVLEPHPDAGTGHLAAKIARVAGCVGTLTKDGKVTGGGRGFSYATHGQMAAALTPLLMAEGIAVFPTAVRVMESHPFQLDGDKYGWRWLTSIEVTWTVTDGETSFVVTTLGKSVDTNGSEKDTNQAMTFARINLYKSLFHLTETGEDPEQKGTARAGDTTGELPDLSDATVNGRVVILGQGTIALEYDILPRQPTQAEVNALVRGLGGKWDKGARHYAIPTEKTEAAVTLARAIGLTIPDKVRERYPVAEAPAEQGSGDGGDPAPKGGDLPTGGTQSDADRRAAEEAGDAAFGEQQTLSGNSAPTTDPPDA